MSFNSCFLFYLIMFIYKNYDAVPWDKCVATVGFFDGVHGGHRFLLNEVQTEARLKQSIAVVVTFNEHPRKILKSDFQPRLLTTLDEKLELMKTTGVDACVVLDFTKELSQLTAQEFIKTILHEHLHVKTLFVGHDHRFGHNREEGFEEYFNYGKVLGMNVIRAEQFVLDGQVASDTTHQQVVLPQRAPERVIHFTRGGRSLDHVALGQGAELTGAGQIGADDRRHFSP